MNIIFITIAYPRTSEESNLYSDLMEEFADHGHKVFVACSIEKRYRHETHIIATGNITVLRVKTGNITANPNYISKGLALLNLQSQLIQGIENYFGNINFDLVLYSTPPIQYNRIIAHLRKKSHTATYLLLKDIFPQNAVDLGLISKANPLYWYFRKQEKTTYRLSDRIGCMSPANVSYLLKNNPEISAEKVEVCPNSLKDRGTYSIEQRFEIRNRVRHQLNLNDNQLLLTYGGNLGVSQGLPFLLEIINAYKDNNSVAFLLVGEGTWYSRIKEFLTQGNYSNVILQKRVPPASFREMLVASDIGLIFLNPRFTIPNFPSRLVSYLEVGLPVIACTDKASDVGDVVEQAGCGFKVLSGDLNGFNTAIKHLLTTPETKLVISSRARGLFEKSYTTKTSYSVITSGT